MLIGVSGKASRSIVNHFKNDHIPWNKGKSGYKTSKSKPILQFDLNGNLVKQFGSCKEAAVEMVCGSENIRRACVGSSKTAKGFRWKYK